MDLNQFAEKSEPIVTSITEESVNSPDQRLMIYPDMILRQPVKAEITVFDDKLTRLVIDMFQTMRTLGGIGLAAPQIGIKLPVITYGVGASEGCMVNPVITSRTGKVVESQEGCLSMPGVKVKVPRHEKIRVQFQDEDGMTQTLDASDLLARVIQHEVDHLSGKTMLDYLSKLKRDMVTSRLTKNNRRWDKFLKKQKKTDRKEFKALEKQFKDKLDELTPPKV